MNKIALVTGASRGLGRNTALHIAKKGGDVVITYQSREQDAQAVVDQIRAMGRQALALRLDVGDVDGFPLFVEHLRAALKQTWGRDSFD
ncbi:SDR family NAD(P)-dependent oxidoreductase, partial [Massilia oculi]